MADDDTSNNDYPGAKKSRERKTPKMVRDAIIDLYFDQEPGTALPPTSKIKEEVDADNRTVLQALDLLLIEGLLVYRATTGFMLTGFGFDTSIERGELGQMLELRMAIEPLAAQSAARAVKLGTASKDKKEALATAFINLTDAFEDQRNVTAAFSADRAFHDAIFELADNPFLYAAARRINIWLTLNVKEVVSALFEDESYRNDTQNEHLAMNEAIADGKPEEAFEAAKDHLKKAHEKIMKKLRHG